MLRRLLSQIAGRSAVRRELPPAQILQFESDAVAFVVNIPEPTRVVPGAELYSPLASFRLRTVPAAEGLAATRPVYLLPLAVFSDRSMRDALQSVGTLVVSKFASGNIVEQPSQFEALLDWLPEARGSTRLIADFSDNYVGLRGAQHLPLLARYQTGLGEHCTLTVPCQALRQELLTYAKHGIHVIEDPFESPRAIEPRAPRSEPVRLCWFGTLGRQNVATVADGLARAAGGLDGRTAELELVTNEARDELVAEIATRIAQVHDSLIVQLVPWSLLATREAIDRCDLVVLPQDHRDPWGRVKSHNRLVESIRGGRLAIASPIPSYVELADYSWVGEDLAAGVRWALSDPAAALGRIRVGQQYVGNRFSPERIAAQWKHVLLAPTPGAVTRTAAAPVEPKAHLRLNLGCGDKILPGYTNVDVAASRAGKSPDVLCDLHDLDPFASDSCAEVLAVHVVEHFWRWEVVAVLKEWVRVLEPGGRMILECPNLLTACEELLKNPANGAGAGQEGQRTMWVFYGDPAWRDPLMCHRWNYTPQSLAAVMAEAGLVNIRQEPAQYKLREPRDMRMVGEKPLG